MPTINGTAVNARFVNAAVTLSFNNPGGTDDGVFASIGAFDAGGATITAVEYGGVAMTQVASIGSLAAGLNAIYALVGGSVPTGANNFTITVSAGTIDETEVNVWGATEVDQATPTSAPTGTGSGSGTASTTTTLSSSLDANDWLVGSVYSYSAASHTITPSDTAITEIEASGDNSSLGSQYSTDGSLNWTLSTSMGFQTVGVVVNHSGGGGGGGVGTQRLLLLGVG